MVCSIVTVLYFWKSSEVTNYLSSSGTKLSSLKTGPVWEKTMGSSSQRNICTRCPFPLSSSHLFLLSCVHLPPVQTNHLNVHMYKWIYSVQLSSLPSLQLLDPHHEVEVTLGVLLDHISHIVWLTRLLQHKQQVCLYLHDIKILPLFYIYSA